MMRDAYIVLAYLVSASLLASAIGHAFYKRSSDQTVARRREKLLRRINANYR